MGDRVLHDLFFCGQVIVVKGIRTLHSICYQLLLWRLFVDKKEIGAGPMGVGESGHTGTTVSGYAKVCSQTGFST